MTPEPKTTFLLRRAEEEAVQAIRAIEATASDVHQELSLRYSAKALHALAEADASHRQETGTP